jgi:hypothetical protein
VCRTPGRPAPACAAWELAAAGAVALAVAGRMVAAAWVSQAGSPCGGAGPFLPCARTLAAAFLVGVFFTLGAAAFCGWEPGVSVIELETSRARPTAAAGWAVEMWSVRRAPPGQRDARSGGPRARGARLHTGLILDCILKCLQATNCDHARALPAG